MGAGIAGEGEREKNPPHWQWIVFIGARTGFMSLKRCDNMMICKNRIL